MSNFQYYILSLALFGVHTSLSQDLCEPIYVTTTGSGLEGTKTAPTSFLEAFTIYSNNPGRAAILMHSGNYSVNQTIDMPGGLMIEGGYEIIENDWVKNSNAQTVLDITPSLEETGNEGHYVGIKMSNVDDVQLKDLQINVLEAGASGTSFGRGRTIYGIHMSLSQGFVFSRISIHTGDGSNGENGLSSMAIPIDGSDGSSGGAGSCDGSIGCNAGHGGDGTDGSVTPGCSGSGTKVSSRAGGSGGNGGSGGPEGDNNGSSGGTGGGNSGQASGGDGGGEGGFACTGSITPGSPGGDGENGANGANGQSYSPGDRPMDYQFAEFFIPGAQSNNGGHGEGGQGGNGGGGGGGQGGTCVNDGSGNGGGGGGGGGQGGEGGAGGYGGGGTFGIYAYISSGQIIDYQINPGAPGSGGIGGDGGPGGMGGVGAGGGSVCTTEVGAGGAGGDGGNGGDGGRGRDGANGVSEQIQLTSSDITVLNNSIPNSVEISLSQNQGCTNSEITITKASGTWDLTETGAIFVNDVDPSTSSFNNLSSIAKIHYATLGSKDVFVDDIQYTNYATIRSERDLPEIDIPNSITLGNTLSLSTATSGEAFDWAILDENWQLIESFDQNPSNYRPNSLGILNIMLRARNSCCGWSIPVFKSVEVLNAPLESLTAVISSSESSLTSNNPFVLNFTFNREIDDFDHSDLSIINGTVESITTNDNVTFEVSVSPIADGEVTVGLPSDKVMDLQGNGNEAVTNFNIQFDGTRPTVEFILAQIRSVVSLGLNKTYRTFEVGFSEDVTNVDIDDFLLSGDAPGDILDIKGSGSSYLIEIDETIANERVNLDFSDGHNIEDLAGNLLNESVINSEEEFPIDGTITSLDDELSHDQIEVYPNSSNGPFEISITNDFFGVIEVDIHDYLGRIVQSHSFVKEDKNQVNEVDISTQPNGIYLVAVRMSNSLTTYRIIKD